MLFWVCFGNEAFFVFLYLVYHEAKTPATLFNSVARTGAAITFPIFLVKQILNGVQLWGASKALIQTDEKEWLSKHKK